MELAAGTHMLFHRKSVYHSLKAEVDLNLLPFLSHLTGTYLVATFHDPPKELREKKQIGGRVTRHLAGVILLSESQRSHFVDLLPPERIFCVPHGVDTEFFQPARALCEEPVVVAVGSYGRDYETFGKAVPLVWEKNPRVRFILIGTRQADEWHPPPRFDDPRVQYLDGISDEELRSTYHAARIAVVPLTDATANNAVLEAMACGLPVVASDVGGIGEYLGEKAGILCPPRDPQALASGVLQVLADPSAASEMGAAGREQALRFEYQVVADELCGVYKKVERMGPRVPPRAEKHS
jgi:glycosyltransferase involved in cell wall biosynthesis